MKKREKNKNPKPNTCNPLTISLAIILLIVLIFSLMSIFKIQLSPDSGYGSCTTNTDCSKCYKCENNACVMKESGTSCFLTTLIQGVCLDGSCVACIEDDDCYLGSHNHCI